MDNRTVIGSRINSALASSNKKQKELAAHLGVPDNTISYFCSGKRVPNAEQIIEISKFLDVSSDYLLGLTENATTDTDLKAVCDYTGLNDKAVTNLSAEKGNSKIITLNELMINKQLFELCGHLTDLKGFSKAYGYDPSFRLGEFVFVSDPQTGDFAGTHITKGEYCDIIRYRAVRLLEKILDEYDIRDQVEDNIKVEYRLVLNKDGEENVKHNPQKE